MLFPKQKVCKDEGGPEAGFEAGLAQASRASRPWKLQPNKKFVGVRQGRSQGSPT